MHLEEALDCIDYGKFDEARYRTRHSGGSTSIADCEQFTARVFDAAKPVKVDMDAFQSCVVYMCLDGTAQIANADGAAVCSLSREEAVLLPAGGDEVTIVPGDKGATLLEAHIREIKEKDEYIREGVPAELEEGKESYGRYKS
ncbi:MAG: hypothetical protein IKX03_00725, partial [Bacteroidales bacterium]|nr:hypothetical protein [Bacteroidales bacterium]